MRAGVHEFFVGGQYIGNAEGTTMAGQAYVRHYAPASVRHRYPIVMIHGGYQTAVNFETTPDGRPGWAAYFSGAGFGVYVMDQPGRGRSGYVSEEYGATLPPFTAERVEWQMTAPGSFERWPQARLHTQWPGSGRIGDATFDQFYAAQVPQIESREIQEQLVRSAGAALLDRIGPAIVLTHSQAGAFGWHLADVRPELVKAILAVEPAGPPFYELDPVGAPDYFRLKRLARPYGLTASAIEYDPPVAEPAEDLPFVREASSPDEALFCCYVQAQPVRKLRNVRRVPVVVVTGEASAHAAYDHCTVAYLLACGVDVTHLRLADVGVHGNGHFMMLERNSDEVASLLCGWLREHALTGRP